MQLLKQLVKYSTLLIFLGRKFTCGEKSITESTLKSSYSPGDLVWQDNFNVLNLSVWDYEANMNGGGNGEFQVYDRNPANAYVKKGILHIKPTLLVDNVFGGDVEKLYNGYHFVKCCTEPPKNDNCGKQAKHPDILPPVQSARLRTKGSFAFKYGKVEVRAQIPSGDWMWPAIWMLPEDNVYGGWPTSGEIDIMEARGNKKLLDKQGVNIGSDQVESTMHFGPVWPQNGYKEAHNKTRTVDGCGFHKDFHLYQMEWTDTGITFSVDNKVTAKVKPGEGGFLELGKFSTSNMKNPWPTKMAPFDQKFHFILNVAVGGNFFPQDTKPFRPWTTGPTFLQFWNARKTWMKSWEGDNAALQVDYIRVWAV